MRQPNNLQWWCAAIVALVIVTAWPPDTGKSLAMKLVNWAVDPADTLPVLPPQLGYGLGDDFAAVERHDEQVRNYDLAYMQGGWLRRRLVLKVANDPFDKSTTRQLLTALGALTALLVWRFGDAKPQ